MHAIYISNYFCFDVDSITQHLSCHLTSEYYILLIECAHVIELNGHAGLCDMTGKHNP